VNQGSTSLVLWVAPEPRARRHGRPGLTGPQNYQAAELLAQKAEARLSDGYNHSAAVWASLARTRAILASAAATTLGELETWAWREIVGSTLSGS